jgi:hypothetical protein
VELAKYVWKNFLLKFEVVEELANLFQEVRRNCPNDADKHEKKSEGSEAKYVLFLMSSFMPGHQQPSTAS